MTNKEEEQSLEDVVGQLEVAGEGERVSFSDLLGIFGQRSFGPLLLVPALIAVGPTGAIPGMSFLTGAIIILVSGQLLLQRDQPWLPKRLTSVSFSRDKVAHAMTKAKPYLARIDRLLMPRLKFMLVPPAAQIIALGAIMMALSMFPLALLPFAVAVPGTAVLLFGVSLVTRDGLIAILGLGIAAIALVLSLVLLV